MQIFALLFLLIVYGNSINALQINKKFITYNQKITKSDKMEAEKKAEAELDEDTLKYIQNLEQYVQIMEIQIEKLEKELDKIDGERKKEDKTKDKK
jgi:3-isopropylmalate dehydratase small subunit